MYFVASTVIKEKVRKMVIKGREKSRSDNMFKCLFET